MPAPPAIHLPPADSGDSHHSANFVPRGVNVQATAPNGVPVLARLSRLESTTYSYSYPCGKQVDRRNDTDTRTPDEIGDSWYGDDAEADSTQQKDSVENGRTEIGSGASKIPGDHSRDQSHPATTIHRLIHEVGCQDATDRKNELSELVVQLQTLTKPLARVIVLLALLTTGAGLAYLALESQTTSSGRPLTPDRAAPLEHGPVFTATLPVDTGHSASSRMVEGSGRGPTARGPAGNYEPAVTITATKPGDFKLVRPAQPQTDTSKTRPAVQDHLATQADAPLVNEEAEVAETHSGALPTSSGSDDSPNTTIYPTTPYSIITIDDPSDRRLRAPEQPTAVAELTGDIQPIRK